MFKLQQMHSLLVTHSLPCTFRVSASHVPGYSYCIPTHEGTLEEQALHHDHQFLKDCTVNAKEITYKIIVDSITMKYGNPPEFLLNSDQAPSSYVSVSKSTIWLERDQQPF